MNTQRDINLTFVALKGFDIESLEGLQKALGWLKTADADNSCTARRQEINLISWSARCADRCS